MVYCYDPYPSCLIGHRPLLLSSVNSGPARYARIIRYHTGVRERVREAWLLGYPPHYPTTLFRCEFILELLNYHREILDYGDITFANIDPLTNLMKALKKVYMVSTTTTFLF
jgi:hypothetical protein